MAWGVQSQFHSSPEELLCSVRAPVDIRGYATEHTPDTTCGYKKTGSPRKLSFWIQYSLSCYQPGHTLCCSSIGPCIRTAMQCSEYNRAIDGPWMQTNKHNWNWCTRVSISFSLHPRSQLRKVQRWNTAINGIHLLHLYCRRKMLALRVPKGIIILSGPCGSSATTYLGERTS